MWQGLAQHFFLFRNLWKKVRKCLVWVLLFSSWNYFLGLSCRFFHFFSPNGLSYPLARADLQSVRFYYTRFAKPRERRYIYIGQPHQNFQCGCPTSATPYGLITFAVTAQTTSRRYSHWRNQHGLYRMYYMWNRPPVRQSKRHTQLSRSHADASLRRSMATQTLGSFPISLSWDLWILLAWYGFAGH